MSTRSRIGIRRKDGSIESIYCHCDGYLEHNGNILFNNYQDISKIEELLNLGNISVLGVEISEVIAYMRDRGETEQEKKIHKNAEEFTKYLIDGWEEYVYIYDENMSEWLYARVPYPTDSCSLIFSSLEQGLASLKEGNNE